MCVRSGRPREILDVKADVWTCGVGVGDDGNERP